jgi:hypothetical protein
MDVSAKEHAITEERSRADAAQIARGGGGCGAAAGPGRTAREGTLGSARAAWGQ